MPRHTVVCVCVCVCLLPAQHLAHSKLSTYTSSNTGRNQYFLGTELIDVWFCSLVCELWCVLLTLIAVAGDLDFSEDKLPTHDCLAAHRFDLYYRIAWRVRRK